MAVFKKSTTWSYVYIISSVILIPIIWGVGEKLYRTGYACSALVIPPHSALTIKRVIEIYEAQMFQVFFGSLMFGLGFVALLFLLFGSVNKKSSAAPWLSFGILIVMVAYGFIIVSAGIGNFGC